MKERALSFAKEVKEAVGGEIASLFESPAAKQLANGLLRRSAKNPKLEWALVVSGAVVMSHGIAKVRPRMVPETESHVVASPERMHHLRDLYGANMPARLHQAAVDGRASREVRAHLPEGQSPRLRVQEFGAWGYQDASIQRFFETMLPGDRTSSTTIFDVRRTEERIPMGYGMAGYEGGHCTRSFASRHGAAQGSHILITPDGFPTHGNPTQQLARVLLHEGAHASDPLDSPDMPEELRFEAMEWLGQRVVRMDDRARTDLSSQIPAGEGFLRFSYPFSIETSNRQRRNEDRAVEYWAELVSTVSSLSSEGGEGDRSSDERLARALLMEVGSGMTGRPAEMQFQDALAHIRFLRRMMPDMDWAARARDFRELRTRLEAERGESQIEQRVFARIAYPEIAAAMREVTRPWGPSEREVYVLRETDPNAIGTTATKLGEVTGSVVPDRALSTEDLEVRHAIRWLRQARNREVDRLLGSLTREQRRWFQHHAPRIARGLLEVRWQREGHYENPTLTENWDAIARQLQTGLRDPVAREAFIQFLHLEFIREVPDRALPASQREVIHRVIDRMQRDREFFEDINLRSSEV
jgi:hypothetical protein